MTISALILFIISLCSSLYQLVAALCALLFRLRKKPDMAGQDWPKAACLKPLCGYDPELIFNLKSFLEQDYPDYEVVFGIKNKEDRVYKTACSLSEENVSLNVRTVTGENGQGANRKVRNLRNIETYLSPSVEIMVLSDSDIRVTQEYLKHVIAPLRNDPSIGAVTCIYRVENTKTLADTMEALSVESAFVPGVLVASTFFHLHLKYAFGASIALKRADFVKAGGFPAIDNYLADDYKIGNIMYKSGKALVLSTYVVTMIAANQNVLNTLLRLVRWNITIRQSQPVGYFFFIITYSTLWALSAFAAIGPGLMGWIVLSTGLIIRIVSASIVAVSIGSKKGILRALLTPLSDILLLFLWFFGLISNNVTWRGIKYRLFSDGKMTEIK
jgi:ceramide glucosyltransferase